PHPAVGARAASRVVPARAHGAAALGRLAARVRAPDPLHGDLRGHGAQPRDLLPGRQLDGARSDDGARQGGPDAHAQPVAEADLRLRARARLSRTTCEALVVTTSTISLDIAEVEALLARIEPLIAKADHECLTSLVGTLIEVTRLLRQGSATIARLRRMLGQTSSEKTANIVGANGVAPSTSEGPETTSGQSEPVAAEPPSGEPRDTPANDNSAGDKSGDTPANDTGSGDKSGDKPRRKGHGRIPASAYASETIAVPHRKLCTGQSCPACAHGSLYAMK